MDIAYNVTPPIIFFYLSPYIFPISKDMKLHMKLQSIHDSFIYLFLIAFVNQKPPQNDHIVNLIPFCGHYLGCGTRNTLPMCFYLLSTHYFFEFF